MTSKGGMEIPTEIRPQPTLPRCLSLSICKSKYLLFQILVHLGTLNLANHPSVEIIYSSCWIN